MKTSPFSVLIDDSFGKDVLATKVSIIHAAYQMLSSEGWGITWFGTDCETAGTRTMFWPASSSL